MHRLGLALVVLTLAGCSALRDAFSAHPAVAASAAGQTLTVERLATWAGDAKKVPLKAEALMSVASTYVDYMLFAVEMAKGRSMDDSLLILRSSWPAVSQTKWERFHDRLVAARTKLTPAAVDSAYRDGQVRLFQHLLLQVPPSAAPTVEQQKRTQIEGLLRQATAHGGANFARLAQRYSEDPGSKTHGGYLQASARGQFVPQFETPAWQLAPGAMSGVVRSPYGFHIIRRPPLAEVRDSFHVELENRITFHFDSVYVDSLAALRHLQVEHGAPALVRQAMQDVIGARARGQTLVSYRGGAFRVRDLVHWVYALNPNDVRGISMASDDQLRQFLKVLAERELLLKQVDSASVQLAPEDWRQIRAGHDSVVTILQNLLGISPQMLKDSAATEDARLRLAATHVDGYLDRVLQGKAQFFPVPPFLGEVLRGYDSWSVNPAGIARAVERAQAIRATADSLSSGAPGAPGGGGGALRPAPGPAPTPIDTTRRRTPH